MKKLLTVPVVVLLTVLTACGSPTATAGRDVDKVDDHAKEVYDEVNGLTGDARTQKLVELAEEEGELSLYTSNTDMQDIVDAFTDTYDLDVNVYRGNSESVLQRVLQESAAGYRGVDLVETNSGELDVLAKEGLLYDYEGELRDAVRPEGQKDGWTADRFNVFVVAWNKSKVKKGSEPTSVEDFTKPEWKGRVSMEVGDVDWFATMYNYYLEQGRSEAEVDELFKKIAGNAKIVKGHTVQAELLAAGEFDAGVSLYSHSTDSGEQEGQPITWHPASDTPIQPLVIRPNGAGLMGTAEHPAAAMLFLDFLLSDGQKAISDANRVGSIPTDDDPLEGLEVIPVDEELMLNEAEAWSDKYADIVEGGESAE